jgi:hypothetical protein
MIVMPSNNNPSRASAALERSFLTINAPPELVSSYAAKARPAMRCGLGTLPDRLAVQYFTHAP